MRWLLLLLLLAQPVPTISARWQGGALVVAWDGPPGSCLYYARPGGASVWLSCDATVPAVLAQGGGDASVSAEPGGRLWVSDGQATLAEATVPALPIVPRVVLPIVAQ